MSAGPRTKLLHSGYGSNTPERPADPPATALGKPRKDTKRWCRGVPGRQHEFVIEYLVNGRYQYEVCRVCGKQVRLKEVKPKDS